MDGCWNPATISLLAQEALAPTRIEHRAPDDLERNLLAHLSVHALGTEHHTHAAATEFLAQDVWTHAIADGDAGRLDGCNGILQHALAVLGRVGVVPRVHCEQGRKCLREFSVVLLDRSQQLGLLCGTQADGLVEQCAQPLPLRSIDTICHADCNRWPTTMSSGTPDARVPREDGLVRMALETGFDKGESHVFGSSPPKCMPNSRNTERPNPLKLRTL